MDNTQVIDLIRYNAYQIRVEAAPSTATLNNYDYLLNLAKRMLAIEEAIIVCEDFENESSQPCGHVDSQGCDETLSPSYGTRGLRLGWYWRRPSNHHGQLPTS